MYSCGVVFKYPVLPKTVPLESSTTTKGKMPCELYFSANKLFLSWSSVGRAFFFFFGKSAWSITKWSLAYNLKISVLQISRSSFIQGAHQSDPWNTKTIGWFCSAAIFFASSKLVSHSCPVTEKDTSNRNDAVKRKFFRWFLITYITKTSHN